MPSQVPSWLICLCGLFAAFACTVFLALMLLACGGLVGDHDDGPAAGPSTDHKIRPEQADAIRKREEADAEVRRQRDKEDAARKAERDKEEAAQKAERERQREKDQEEARRKSELEYESDGLVLLRKTLKGTGNAFSSKITGTVENRNSRKVNAHIAFNLYGKDGARIGTAFDTILNLAPGERWNFSAITASDFSTFKVSELRAR